MLYFLINSNNTVLELQTEKDEWGRDRQDREEEEKEEGRKGREGWSIGPEPLRKKRREGRTALLDQEPLEEQTLTSSSSDTLEFYLCHLLLKRKLALLR